jgi:hypothetical protein
VPEAEGSTSKGAGPLFCYARKCLRSEILQTLMQPLAIVESLDNPFYAVFSASFISLRLL